MNRIVVFSGSAHLALAATICRRLRTRLSEAEITTFSNDCLGVQLKTNCRGADVFVVSASTMRQESCPIRRSAPGFTRI